MRWNLSQLHLLHLGLLWVGLLFGCLTVYVTILMLLDRKRHKTPLTLPDSKAVTNVRERPDLRVDRVAVLAALAFGFVLGWGWGRIPMNNTYYDVGIIDRYDSTHYLMRIGGVEANETFCGPESFEPGEKLRWMTYRDEVTCWDVDDSKGVGFQYYKQNGTAVKFADLEKP